MADWTTIPDTTFEPGAPAKGRDMRFLRDNPVAIAEGAAGAPRIKTAALEANIKNHIRAASGLNTMGDVYLTGSGDRWSSSTSYTQRVNEYILFRNNTGVEITVQFLVGFNEAFSIGAVDIQLRGNGAVLATQTVTGDTTTTFSHTTSAPTVKYTIWARATDGGATGETYFRQFTAAISSI